MSSEIVVDTSAFVAVFRQEKGWRECEGALSYAAKVWVPASCRVEVALLRRAGADFFDWFEAITGAPVYGTAELVPDVVQLAIATARRYGKGSGHPAQLNFGDCFSYAVARHRDMPLLFVGTDFSHTDVRPALVSTPSG